MAYGPLPGKAVGDTITQPNWTNIKDNFDASGIAIVAAKGDLAVATGASALARLPVGADGTALVADSGEATGLLWQIQPACHLTKSGNTPMGSIAWTAIDFDTETSDPDGMHEGITNPSRITIPANGDGWFIFGFYGIATGGDPDTWKVRIRLNGITTLVQASGWRYDNLSLSLTMGYPLAATDYLQVEYWTPRADMTISADPAFWAIFQRP